MRTISRVIEKYKLMRWIGRSRFKSLRSALTPLKLTVIWAVLRGHTVLYNFKMIDGKMVYNDRPALIANGYVNKGTIMGFGTKE